MSQGGGPSTFNVVFGSFLILCGVLWVLLGGGCAWMLFDWLRTSWSTAARVVVLVLFAFLIAPGVFTVLLGWRTLRTPAPARDPRREPPR